MSMDVQDRLEPDVQRSKGHVKFFNMEKGFGFLTRPYGDDVYVHQHDLTRQGINPWTFTEGLACEFTHVPNKRRDGRRVRDITLLNKD